MNPMPHDELIKKAEEAITAVFSDTSVSQETTLQSLKQLSDRISELTELIEHDLESNEPN